jgi:hypothetical protein
MLEPWYIKHDRKVIANMRRVIEGKGDNETVRYLGDQLPVLVSEVKRRIVEREARIEADIAKFNEVGGDYDKM